MKRDRKIEPMTIFGEYNVGQLAILKSAKTRERIYLQGGTSE
ncbi:hypothetical protein BH18THE2_BH18THE2_19710 [soil metagenome]